MAPRPAYVHPSALSPAEYDAYAIWIDELDSQISKLGRGLRFGEILAFIRKRTPVDREAEIMSFFGSIPQQQSLGIGEFIAILRLLAHARTCATLTRDHIFIQTHPLVLTTPLTTHPTNPFFKPPSTNTVTERLEGPKEVNLREAAAKKKRLPPPHPVASTVLSRSNEASSSSPITPKASSNNPFRMQPTPESPAQELRGSRQSSTLPPTPPESTIAAKSPPLPPRPSSIPQQPPPKHASQIYKRLDDGTQTPTLIKPLHVPALGPTSLDIISSSLQSEHTGQSNASSGTKPPSKQTTKVPQQSTGSRKTTDNGVRLLGSSHIGVDAKPLRAKPPSARHGSSSEDIMLHKNTSDSSLSSLAGMLPRGRRDTYSTVTTSSTFNFDGRDSRCSAQDEEDSSRSHSGQVPAVNSNGQTVLKGLVVKSTPPLPPPPRRRPESLYIAQAQSSTAKAQKLVFGSTPATGHPAPYTATSIQSSPAKHRTNSVPGMTHGRAASVAGSSYSQPTYGRPLVKAPAGLVRATSVTHKHNPLDSIISRGRDVSHDWLEKARSGVLASTAGDRQGLISADEVTCTARESTNEDDSDSQSSEADLTQRQTVKERRMELERIRTEEEPGWARLE